MSRWSRRKVLTAAGGLAVAACASEPTPVGPPVSPPTPPGPVLTPVASAYPLIIDTATDTRPYLGALKALGVRSVMRYYATAAQPEVPQKQLTLPERDAILDAGMSIGSVFQYYSNVAENIHAARGKQDGETVLARVASFAQPAGSAVYFGIDFDWAPADAAKRDNIIAYFTEVSALLKPANYRVGVYGSGATCNAVLGAGLAELAWLVNSPGHTGASSFYNSGRWRLFQNGLDTKVAGGIQIDTSLINSNFTDFGQWGRPGADVALPMELVNTIFNGRRFVAKKSAKLRSAANDAAPEIVNTRFGKGRMVRVLGFTTDGWAQVDVNETGAATGWCREADLGKPSSRPDYYAAD